MKKLLALVLALVMTMSLAVVSTNAATKYSDASDIKEGKYGEAIDVMSAIGVLGGDNGAFRPNDNLKRSEGAKIIAYLLLGNTAAEQIKGGTKFTDVPASHWAAGYIEYLAVEGVVGGIGDGKFDPDGPLTTAAFTKMLLGALGYDATIEGLGGPDWMINVQKLAKQVNLFDGNKEAVATSNITRQEAALYAFNTIKSPLVEYENKGATMTVNGATISFGAGKASYKVDSSGKPNNTRYNQISNKEARSNGVNCPVIEFAEEYYDKLKLRGNGDTDDLMRKADKWTYDGREIGTYNNSYDLLYTKTVTLGEIYKDLNLTTDTPVTQNKEANSTSTTGAFGADVNSNVNYFIDGVAYDMAGKKDIITLKKESNVKIGGNGTETYVYYDEGIVRICEVNWYVGDVAGVYAATSSKDAYIDIAGRGSQNHDTYNYSGTKKTTDFKVDDVVLYTASWKDGATLKDHKDTPSIQDVVKAETVEGELNGFVMIGKEGKSETATGSVTIAGKKYTYSAQVAGTPEGNFLRNGTKLKIVLDKYGYAIDVADYDVQDFAVVVNKGVGGSYSTDSNVNLLLTDGTTTGAVTLNSDNHKNTGIGGNVYYGTNTTIPTNTVEIGDIVTYSINSSNKYTLTRMAQAKLYKNGVGATSKMIVTNGQYALSDQFIEGPNDQNSNNNQKIANGKTVFLIKDTTGNYKAYEGIKNVPTITAKLNGANVIINSFAGQNSKTGAFYSAARVVYVELGQGAQMTNKDTIFVHIEPNINQSVIAGEYYYEYEAYVNGVKENLKIESVLGRALHDAYPNGDGYEMYTSMTKDSKGIATLGDNKGAVYGTTAIKNGVVGLGSKFYSYAKDVKVFYINENGEITPSSINGIPSNTTAYTTKAWFNTDDAGDVTYVFWTKVANATTITNPTAYNNVVTLQTALNNNDVVVVSANNVEIPAGLVVPAGKILRYTGDASYSSATPLYVNGTLEVQGNFTVDNTAGTGGAATVKVGYIGTAKQYTGNIHTVEGVIKVGANGHIDTTGTVISGGTTDLATISGSSIAVYGGSLKFNGKVQITGKLTVDVSSTLAAVLSFLQDVEVTNTADVKIKNALVNFEKKLDTSAKNFSIENAIVMAKELKVTSEIKLDKDSTLDLKEIDSDSTSNKITGGGTIVVPVSEEPRAKSIADNTISIVEESVASDALKLEISTANLKSVVTEVEANKTKVSDVTASVANYRPQVIVNKDIEYKVTDTKVKVGNSATYYDDDGAYVAVGDTLTLTVTITAKDDTVEFTGTNTKFTDKKYIVESPIEKEKIVIKLKYNLEAAKAAVN